MTNGPLDYASYPRYPTRDIRHIPGDSGIPIIGDTFNFLRDFSGLTQRKYDQYGSIFRVNALFQDTIVMLGPQANEAVLKDTGRCFSNTLAWNLTLDKIFPNGLMLKDFDEHKYHRRILQAAFKRPAIERYISAMSPGIDLGLESWPQGKPFSFYPQVKSLLLNIAASVFLGLNVEQEAEPLNRSFIHAVDATLALVRVNIPGNRWWKGQQGRAYLETFVRRHLEQKRVGHDADIFAQLCRLRDEDGQYLSDQAVVDHTIFLLFAAHDTTTSTLCSIVYALAKNPRWQDALREEFRGISGEITQESMKECDTAALVFREALRMYPPLPTIPRRCVRETEVMGFRIPRNAGVGISPLFTHYMPELWSDPHRFDPERFSSGRAEDNKHFFQFIPFGGGAHKCLGLHFAEIQSKLFLYHFLSNYEVSVQPGYEMAYSVVPMSLPTDGLPVTVRRINAGRSRQK
jgi:cytochrome P450